MPLFFLEAFERVHKAKVEEYERMVTEVDNKVKETEPGILIHAQIKVSEKENEVVYRWVEVYEKYENLEFHFGNPAVQEHIQKMTKNEVLCAPLEVIVYCDWTEDQKEPWKQIPGVNFKFAPLVNGYFR